MIIKAINLCEKCIYFAHNTHTFYKSYIYIRMLLFIVSEVNNKDQ